MCAKRHKNVFRCMQKPLFLIFAVLAFNYSEVRALRSQLSDAGRSTACQTMVRRKTMVKNFATRLRAGLFCALLSGVVSGGAQAQQIDPGNPIELPEGQWNAHRHISTEKAQELLAAALETKDQESAAYALDLVIEALKSNSGLSLESFTGMTGEYEGTYKLNLTFWPSDFDAHNRFAGSFQGTYLVVEVSSYAGRTNMIGFNVTPLMIAWPQPGVVVGSL